MLLALAPLASASPSTPFPEIPFSDFSTFITSQFGPDISLATVLALLYTLTDNPEFLNLHGRQQHSKVEGENHYPVTTTWMKALSRLLLGQRLERSARRDLFRSSDHVVLSNEDDYTTAAVNALARKLDSMVLLLRLGPFKSNGKLRHRRKPISYKSIEPVHLILPQAYQCDSDACAPYSLTQGTRYTQIPQVTLVRGSDSVTAYVLHGDCTQCHTTYYADHTRFRTTDEGDWQRAMLNSSRFVKLGQSTWADRTFTNSVLNATYSFHASTSAYAQYWTSSFGQDTGVSITRPHIWQAFVAETIFMLAQDLKIDLVVPDNVDIDTVVTNAFACLAQEGVMECTKGHGCTGCHHERRFGPNEQHLNPADYAPVTMAVVDGMVVAPTVS